MIPKQIVELQEKHLKNGNKSKSLVRYDKNSKNLNVLTLSQDEKQLLVNLKIYSWTGNSNQSKSNFLFKDDSFEIFIFSNYTSDKTVFWEEIDYNIFKNTLLATKEDDVTLTAEYMGYSINQSVSMAIDKVKGKTSLDDLNSLFEKENFLDICSRKSIKNLDSLNPQHKEELEESLYYMLVGIAQSGNPLQF